MNGKRRFLLGTVLSIQNTGFTYPACHNCFSRVTHTSNRYQCQKCGKRFQDATQRYRLCVKVAEDQKLHIITAFGSCLERIFGSSADSLHRELQESERPLCDGGWEKGQQLLFQAAEDYMIGRSFVFAVKVTDHLQRDGSAALSHLVACQIIPINNDPSASILNRYHHLAEFILSNSSINTRHEPSAHSAHKGFWDLADSESSQSLHHSENQFADYWQRSLGLASSPTLNTSTASLSCSPSQSQPTKAKEQSCEGGDTFEERDVLAQSNVNREELKVIIKDDLCIPKNSPVRVNNPSATIVKPHADTCGYNQSSSRANRLSSRVNCRHHRHLQNVCDSSSYGRQDCSACRKRFPSQNTQTAESHQVESGTWDEFPFSESLSEFIVRLENSEEERFQFGVQENKFCVKNNREEFHEGLPNTEHDFCKTPGAVLARSSQKIKNNRSTKTITPHSFGDPRSKTVVSHDPCEMIQSSGSEEVLACSSSESLQGLLQKRFIRDSLPEDSIASVASFLYPSMRSHQETISPINEPSVVTEGERNFQISNLSPHNSKNIHKYILPVGKYSSFHPQETEDVDNERRSEGDDLCLLRPENLDPMKASPGGYDASADLFDTGTNAAEEFLGETLQSNDKRSLKRRHGTEVGSLKNPPFWESPCTDVIVRRHSQFQGSCLQDVHETGTIHDLFLCLQSTPVQRPLSESSFLTGNGCMVSEPRAPVLSRRSSYSLTNFLLKNIKQSLKRSHSNVFCTISDHFRLCSPVSTSFSEMSRRQVFQRRKTLAIKSGKKKMISGDKENCNIRGCNDRSNEDGGDGSIVTRQEINQPEMDIVEDGETASLLMSPLHMVTVLKAHPSDWSPELFNENSNIFKPSDTIQRRLF